MADRPGDGLGDGSGSGLGDGSGDGLGSGSGEEAGGEPGRRLDDHAVAERMARLDEVLDRLERMPGATAETALDAVALLTEVYGEAIARVAALAAPGSALATAFGRDRLLGHLLVLHDAHPEPVERRVLRALDGVRPHLGGAGAELAGIDGDVARVRLTGGGCGSASGRIAALVRDAVLAAAPELSGVEPARTAARAPEAFIPADSLLRRPAHLPEGAAAGLPEGAAAGVPDGAAAGLPDGVAGDRPDGVADGLAGDLAGGVAGSSCGVAGGPAGDVVGGAA
jgi:hypothetical protein